MKCFWTVSSFLWFLVQMHFCEDDINYMLLSVDKQISKAFYNLLNVKLTLIYYFNKYFHIYKIYVLSCRIVFLKYKLQWYINRKQVFDHLKFIINFSIDFIIKLDFCITELHLEPHTCTYSCFSSLSLLQICTEKTFIRSLHLQHRDSSLIFDFTCISCQHFLEFNSICSSEFCMWVLCLNHAHVFLPLL